MQKHLAPYTNRIQLADIQLFYAVQDTVADACKVPISYTLNKTQKELHYIHGRYALIYRIYAENELFMPGNNLFSCFGTKCLLYLNNVFRYSEHFVSNY